VGCGGPLEGDGLWLRGNERQFGVDDNRLLATLWGKEELVWLIIFIIVKN
jgi:hypothetical protein